MEREGSDEEGREETGGVRFRFGAEEEEGGLATALLVGVCGVEEVGLKDAGRRGGIGGVEDDVD